MAFFKNLSTRVQKL